MSQQESSGGTGTTALLERLTPDAHSLVRTVGEIASRLGSAAFLVGGPVRDLMLERPVVDLDFAVEGEALSLAQAVARRLNGQTRVHGRFGTATVVLPKDGELDLATTRAETYPGPGALPEVRPAALREDLRRRDFTVNAMALAVGPAEWGRLIDPHGGAADLNARRLRVLHPGSLRDDPTRVLRGVRLEQRLQFRLAAETELLAASAVGDGAFDTLTPERLRDALELLFREPRPVEGIGRLRELGFWQWFAPDLQPDQELLAGLGEQLAPERAAASESLRVPLLWLAGLLAPLGGQRGGEVATDRMRLAPRAAADLGIMVDALTRLREWMARPPATSAFVAALKACPEETPVLLAAAADDEALRQRLAWYRRDGAQLRLAIDGGDLLALGYAAGPALGAALRVTLAAKLDGQLHGREAELEFARRWLQDEGEAGRGELRHQPD